MEFEYVLLRSPASLDTDPGLDTVLGFCAGCLGTKRKWTAFEAKVRLVNTQLAARLGVDE